MLFGTLVGAIIVLAALIFMWKPPKKINGLYGYRTPSSMKNQKTWDIANSYAPKAMLVAGLITLATGLVLDLTAKEETAVLWTCVVMTIALIGSIVATERHLKKRL